MFIINKLLLLSGNGIPFKQAQVIIHQPTVNQISYIGEDTFFTGCQYLNFSKDNLSDEDKNRLNGFNNFEILMTIMRDNDTVIKRNKVCMQLVLQLLFPQFKIDFLPMSIRLSKKTQEGLEQHLIDKDNFENFKKILKQMFCLKQVINESSQYNPGGPQAQALVEKFKQRKKKLAELKSGGKKQSISILSQYVSILAVGEKKDINQLLQYTIYQLFDEFHRFRLKEEYDIYIKAKMAGAKDLQEIENWMKDIHSDTL